MCHLYQGSARAKEEKNAIVFFRKAYCYVCRFYHNYYFEDSHNIKNGSFKLEKYLNIFRDLTEIFEISTDVSYFWEVCQLKNMIHHFLSHGYYYCVCDLYQGCQTWGDYLVGIAIIVVFVEFLITIQFMI